MNKNPKKLARSWLTANSYTRKKITPFKIPSNFTALHSFWFIYFLLLSFVHRIAFVEVETEEDCTKVESIEDTMVNGAEMRCERSRGEYQG